jgi:hypothetical protein
MSFQEAFIYSDTRRITLMDHVQRECCLLVLNSVTTTQLILISTHNGNVMSSLSNSFQRHAEISFRPRGEHHSIRVAEKDIHQCPNTV